MKWITVSAFMAFTRRDDGKALLVYVSEARGNWAVTAIESEIHIGDERRPIEQVMARVFDSHAHAVLTPERTMVKAMGKAEKYARWWKRSRVTSAPCPCEIIQHGGVATSKGAE